MIQLGRLARIAGVGMKASPAFRDEALIGKAIMQERGAQRASMLRDIAPATNLPKDVMGPTLPGTAKFYINEKLPQYKSWDDAYKTADWVDKAAYHTGRIGGGGARLAGSTLSSPVGQTALFMGVPMLMMGSPSGGEEMPPEYYQQQPMDAYGPVSMPPQMSAPMMASSALDEEQIRRARKRAEEQAALNSFYAQALTQYNQQ